MFVKVTAHGFIDLIISREKLKQLSFQDEIGLEAGLEVMGRTTDINAFFATIIPIFDVCISLNILQVANKVLGLHVGALASIFIYENLVREPNVVVAFTRSHPLSDLEVKGVKEGKFISAMVGVSFVARLIIVFRHVRIKFVFDTSGFGHVHVFRIVMFIGRNFVVVLA